MPNTAGPKSDQSPARTHFVGARTQDYRLARYVEDWRLQIEKFGTEHFPEVVRKRGLFGTVVVTTFVQKDGSVGQIQINKTSGHPELDDATKALISRAAPFARLPDELQQQFDILAITREFTFAR